MANLMLEESLTLLNASLCHFLGVGKYSDLDSSSLSLPVPSLFCRLPCGYKWVSSLVSALWPTVILCSGPAGSPHVSPKQIHARDGVGGGLHHPRGRGGASLAHVTVTCGYQDYVMVTCYQ